MTQRYQWDGNGRQRRQGAMEKVWRFDLSLYGKIYLGRLLRGTLPFCFCWSARCHYTHFTHIWYWAYVDRLMGFQDWHLVETKDYQWTEVNDFVVISVFDLRMKVSMYEY